MDMGEASRQYQDALEHARASSDEGSEQEVKDAKRQVEIAWLRLKHPEG